MNEILSQIKSVALTHTNNDVKFGEESDTELKFHFQGHAYIVSVDEAQSITCAVIFLGEDSSPYIIDEELESLLNNKLELDQGTFKIGINKCAHITWSFEHDEIEKMIASILDDSDKILNKVIDVANKIKKEKEEGPQQAESKQAGTVQQASTQSVPEIIQSAFKSKDWKYTVRKNEGANFVISTGFGAEKYEDSDNDKHYRIFILYEGKQEVVFNAPNVYNLLKGIEEDKNNEEKTLLRQAKLALLNLFITTTRKFVSMTYDVNDGEVRYEARVFLDENNSFSIRQTVRGIDILSSVIEDFNSKFIGGVMDDDVSSAEFSKRLFKAKESSSAEYIVEKISEQNENMDKLTDIQKDELAKKMAVIAQEMLDQQSSTD